jgi:hypothetical protein
VRQEPKLQFSRPQLNRLCGILDELQTSRTAHIAVEDIKKMKRIGVQLRTYERIMVSAGYWGEGNAF